MKKQDALFQLIKSLTRGEKRNFRILAQLTAGDKKYLQLFDVIDDLEDYDEQKILKKFKGDDKFAKQLAYNKNYLYNTILNSLAYFHKGVEAEVSSVGLHVRILMEKNLYHQARKLLNRAKESVASRERFEELLKLLRTELDIVKTIENLKLMPEAIREIEFSERVTIDKISNLLEYQRLDSQTFLLISLRNMARKEDDLAEVTRLLKHPLLQEESSALSTKARMFFNECHRRLAYYQGAHAEAAHFAGRVVDLFEAAPAILEDDKLTYLKQVVLLAHHSAWVGGPDSAYRILEKIMNVRIATPQERVARFDKYYVYGLGLKVSLGDVVPDEYISSFIEELETLENDLAVATRLTSYYILAHYFLIMEEHSKAVQWINRFLNHPRTNLRADLQSGMRIMNLIAHLELGNDDLIEYNLKSTYRFIYKIERMHRYERQVLRFIRDVIALPDKAQRPMRIKAFSEELQEILKDPFEARADDVFSVSAWIAAKLEGIPMRVAKKREGEEGFGITARGVVKEKVVEKR